MLAATLLLTVPPAWPLQRLGGGGGGGGGSITCQCSPGSGFRIQWLGSTCRARARVDKSGFQSKLGVSQSGLNEGLELIESELEAIWVRVRVNPG